MVMSKANTRAHPAALLVCPLLSEQEVAEELGLAVTTLRRWRWARRGLPFLKIGRAVRYDPKDVAALRANGRKEPFKAATASDLDAG